MVVLIMIIREAARGFSFQIMDGIELSKLLALHACSAAMMPFWANAIAPNGAGLAD